MGRARPRWGGRGCQGLRWPGSTDASAPAPAAAAAAVPCTAAAADRVGEGQGAGSGGCREACCTRMTWAASGLERGKPTSAQQAEACKGSQATPAPPPLPFCCAAPPFLLSPPCLPIFPTHPAPTLFLLSHPCLPPFAHLADEVLGTLGGGRGGGEAQVHLENALVRLRVPRGFKGRLQGWAGVGICGVREVGWGCGGRAPALHPFIHFIRRGNMHGCAGHARRSKGLGRRPKRQGKQRLHAAAPFIFPSHSRRPSTLFPGPASSTAPPGHRGTRSRARPGSRRPHWRRGRPPPPSPAPGSPACHTASCAGCWARAPTCAGVVVEGWVVDGQGTGWMNSGAQACPCGWSRA